MKRNTLLMGLGVMVVTALFLALGNRTVTTVQADPQTMSWDMYMTDPVPAINPASCTLNDNDGKIETGECPTVTSNVWLRPEGGMGATQSLFDRADIYWTTGPMGATDVTGDGLNDVTAGMASSRPATLGAKVGTLTFQIGSSLETNLLLTADIDDVNMNNDPQVAGQGPSLNRDQDGDTVYDVGKDGKTLGPTTLELWNAVVNTVNGTVSNKDTDASGLSDTQDPDAGHPAACTVPATANHACQPKGVRLLPSPIPALEAAMGVPVGSAISRAYGIAHVSVAAGLTDNSDVNFLVYQLNVGGVNETLNLTLLNYPGIPSTPSDAPGFNFLGQTVKTGPPFYTAPVDILGVTASADFDGDTTTDLAIGGGGNPPVEVSRKIVGTGGPWDYRIMLSQSANFDGDTIPEVDDRCDFDATGTAAQDTDGDTLTGICDTNGEGATQGPNANNPGPFTALVPFSAGQDVDGDGYLNFADNCPNVANGKSTDPNVQADTDRDSVGDSCDPAPTVPGNGNGYAVPAPGLGATGGFWQNANICNNRWVIGDTVPKGEAGDWAMKYCLVDTTVATTTPYVNPILAGARLAGYRDADGDVVPDFWDGLTSAAPPPAGKDVYDYFDTSDADGDTFTDGCESFRGTDSLDASSKPAAPSVAGDCDGDGSTDVAELAAHTNPLKPAVAGGTFNSSGDGACSDAEKTAKGYDPTKWYDFYDVPVPVGKDPVANGPRNGSIDMGDVLAVLFYSGAAQGGPPNGNLVDYDSDKNLDGIPDGVDFDRTPGTPLGPPDTSIDMGDVIATLGQVGKSCDAKGTLQ